jgi:ATP/maltotriose-dependent transcriptional regulator MalT
MEPMVFFTQYATAGAGAGQEAERAPLLPAMEVAALHRRAAADDGAQGEVMEAIEQALEEGHQERALSLIEQHWERMYWRGEYRTVERWLRALPAALIPTRSALSIAQAAIHAIQFQIGQAEQVLNACRFMAADGPASCDLRGKAQTLLGFIARARGDREQSMVRLCQAQELLDPDNLIWRSVVLYNLGLLHADRRELERAAEALAEATAAAEEARKRIGLRRVSYASGQLWENPEALRKLTSLYQAALPSRRGLDGEARGGSPPDPVPEASDTTRRGLCGVPVAQVQDRS